MQERESYVMLSPPGKAVLIISCCRMQRYSLFLYCEDVQHLRGNFWEVQPCELFPV